MCGGCDTEGYAQDRTRSLHVCDRCSPCGRCRSCDRRKPCDRRRPPIVSPCYGVAAGHAAGKAMRPPHATRCGRRGPWHRRRPCRRVAAGQAILAGRALGSLKAIRSTEAAGHTMGSRCGRRRPTQAIKLQQAILPQQVMKSQHAGPLRGRGKGPKLHDPGRVPELRQRPLRVVRCRGGAAELPEAAALVALPGPRGLHALVLGALPRGRGPPPPPWRLPRLAPARLAGAAAAGPPRRGAMRRRVETAGSGPPVAGGCAQDGRRHLGKVSSGSFDWWSSPAGHELSGPDGLNKVGYAMNVIKKIQT